MIRKRIGVTPCPDVTFIRIALRASFAYSDVCTRPLFALLISIAHYPARWMSMIYGGHERISSVVSAVLRHILNFIRLWDAFVVSAVLRHMLNFIRLNHATFSDVLPYLANVIFKSRMDVVRLPQLSRIESSIFQSKLKVQRRNPDSSDGIREQ